MSLGGGKGGSSHQTTTQTSDPWKGQQPYLLTGFADAKNLLNQGGPQYYPGTTYAPPTNDLLAGINAQAQLGQTGTPVQHAAEGAATNMLSPDWLMSNPSNPLYGLAGMGGLNADTGGYFAPIAAGMSSWQPGMGTLADFASGATANAGNPYFQQMAATTIGNILPQIQSQFASGNRLDSGLASRAVGQGLGDAIGGLAYQNYQQGLGQQQSAAEQLANLGQNSVAQRLAAAQGLTGVEQGNAQNMLAGAAGLGGNYNTAAQNQIQQTALAPQTTNMSYDQAAALQGAGQAQQGLNQQAINDAVQRWNYNQQLPYNTLNNYISEIQGNYGGTQKTQTPYASNTLNDMLQFGVLAGLPSLFG